MNPLDSLLAEWEQYASKYYDENNFAYDGIMFRGDFNCPSLNRIKREPSGDEYENWNKAPLRVCFVLKDQNCPEDAWDLRTEVGYLANNPNNPYRAFNKNLIYTLYGIINTTAQTAAPFDFPNQNKSAIELYKTEPLARINVKKEAGKNSISNGALIERMERDKKFIIKQIKLLDADVIICCGKSNYVSGTGNVILNFIKDNCYQLEEVPSSDGILYYDKNIHKLCINSYHPSFLRRWVDIEKAYIDIVSKYHKFLVGHPDFPCHKSLHQ